MWIYFNKVSIRKTFCTKPFVLISYICDKTLLPPSICNKCGSGDEKISKEEESIEILKIFWFN